MDRGKLKLQLHKVKARFGRSFTATPAVCQPVGAAATPNSATETVTEIARETDLAIDAYLNENAREGTGAPQLTIDADLSQDDFDRDMQCEMGGYDPEYGESWEEECERGDTPIERRTKGVEAPCVMARGTIDRSRYKCWACGERAAHDLQMPDELFHVAYTKDGAVGAIRAIKCFGEMLEKREFEKAITRTTCCRKLQCMISQEKLTAENYETWRFSAKDGDMPRMQLERGTERMDQGVVFSDNILLLRWIFMLKDDDGEAVLSKPQIRALFHWVVLNSRFVQEREMRYIATAMAIVDSSTFPYKFPDPQAFVNQMAGVARTYCERRLLGHIFDTALDNYHWKSWGNRLLETAFPKAADVAYMLMCRENWLAQGRPYDNGRPAHRVAPDSPHEVLFTAEGFAAALQLATKENKTYELRYASATTTHNTIKGVKAQTRDETRALLKAVSGTHRGGPLKANGVQGRKCAPTDGARQADSSVHSEQRYDGACEGLGFDETQKAEVLALMLNKHMKGNSVGHEKLEGLHADRTKSKACAALRPIEIYTPQQARPVFGKRRLAAFVNAVGIFPIKQRRLGAGIS